MSIMVYHIISTNLFCASLGLMIANGLKSVSFLAELPAVCKLVKCLVF